MAPFHSLQNIRLLATGTVPDRPTARPVHAHASAPCRRRVTAWRRMQDIADETPLAELWFSDKSGRGVLHSDRLRQHWPALCAGETPVLVYLHRGHQPDTRCPVLQNLLQALDHTGPVYALRVESGAALHDAMTMARALTVENGLSVVLRDPTERLTAHPERSLPLRYALLGNSDFAPRPAPAPPIAVRPASLAIRGSDANR